MRHLVSVMAICSTLLAAERPAAVRAQEPPRPPDTVEHARALFEQALRAIEDGRYQEAAVALEGSLAIRETAPVRYNLGVAYRGLGRYRDAIAAFERFQDLAGDLARFAQMRATVGGVLSELRGALVRIRLTARGGVEELRVDDRPVATADGSYEVQADPGRHVVLATRRGHRPVERTVDLARGETATIELDVSGGLLPGSVAVTANVPGALLVVDGRVIGRGRYQGDVPPGRYRVEARAEGFVTSTRMLEVTPGAQLTLDLVLGRSEAPAGDPFYQQWWFWTGAGAVVVGAVVAALALTITTTVPYDNGTLGFTVEALR